MLWWPLANMLPIALRMTMAKTEMTMLYRQYQCTVAHVPKFLLIAIPCPCVEGGDHGLHGGRICFAAALSGVEL